MNRVLLVPEDAWKILNETLKLDSQSRAFSHGLRSQIADALNQVEDVTDRMKALVTGLETAIFELEERTGYDTTALKALVDAPPEEEEDEDAWFTPGLKMPEPDRTVEALIQEDTTLRLVYFASRWQSWQISPEDPRFSFSPKSKPVTVLRWRKWTDPEAP